MVTPDSLITAAYVALYSLLLGTVYGALYDIVRILRILTGVGTYSKKAKSLRTVKLPLIDKKHGKGTQEQASCDIEKEKKKRSFFADSFIFLTDLLYFFITALIFCVFAFHANSGHVRWYMFLGSIAGFFAYYFTAGKLVMLFSEYIVFAVRCVLRYLLYFLSLPFLLLFRVVKRVIRKLYLIIIVPVKKKAELKKLSRATDKLENELAAIVKMQ